MLCLSDVAVNSSGIMDDEFIKDYIDDLQHSIRTQALVEKLGSFKRVTLNSLAHFLLIQVQETEELVAKLILEERIFGKIDQVEKVLVLEEVIENSRSVALLAWAAKIKGLDSTINGRLNKE